MLSVMAAQQAHHGKLLPFQHQESAWAAEETLCVSNLMGYRREMLVASWYPGITISDSITTVIATLTIISFCRTAVGRTITIENIEQELGPHIK